MDVQHQLYALLASLVAVVGLGEATALGERADGVIRMITLGAFVGSGIAYRRHLRRPDLDPFPIITRWSWVGLGFGVALAIGGGLT